MQNIELPKGRTIVDHLVSRKSGSFYDTYYKALEGLGETYVDAAVDKILDNTFIYSADADGMARWESFYPKRPYDMTVDSYKNLIYILNDCTRLGPTSSNILRLLQFFDSTVSFSKVEHQYLWEGQPPYYAFEITASGTATDTLTTTWDWDDSSGMPIVDHIWKNGTLVAAADFTGTTHNYGDKLQIEIAWVTPPTAGTSYSVIVNLPGLDGDDPESQFFSQATAEFPDTEAYIYSESSDAPRVNEWFLLDDAALLYETSVMDVQLESHRDLLLACLSAVIPANVHFKVRFISTPMVTLITSTDSVGDGAAIVTYSPTYSQTRTYQVDIPGLSTAYALHDVKCFDNGRFVIVICEIANKQNQSVYYYDGTTRAASHLFSNSHGNKIVKLTDTKALILHGGAYGGFHIYTIGESAAVSYVNTYTATGGLLSEAFTAANEQMLDASVTPEGYVLFTMSDGNVLPTYYLRVVNIFDNIIITDFELSSPTVRPWGATALTSEKVIFWSGDKVHFATQSAGTYSENTADLTLSSGGGTATEHLIHAINVSTIFLTRNNGFDYEIYSIAFDGTPVITTPLLTVTARPNAISEIIDGDLVISDYARNVTVFTDFTENLLGAVRTDYVVGGSTSTIYPVQIFEED